MDGQISPAYWKLLQIVDPDRIYSYTNLPQALLDKLMAEIGPLQIGGTTHGCLKVISHITIPHTTIISAQASITFFPFWGRRSGLDHLRSSPTTERMAPYPTV